MKLEVKYSSKFKKGLKLATKRGLDISLLENVVEKLRNRIPLGLSCLLPRKSIL